MEGNFIRIRGVNGGGSNEMINLNEPLRERVNIFSECKFATSIYSDVLY